MPGSYVITYCINYTIAFIIVNNLFIGEIVASIAVILQKKHERCRCKI